VTENTPTAIERANWIALRITPHSNREGVIAALFEAGSQGVQEDGTSLITHFPPEAEIDDIRRSVMSVDPHAAIASSAAPETDYSKWRAAVSPHQIGALAVVPLWLAEEFDPDTTIVIDPAMAFGTGEHQTTRGVLRLMQGFGLTPSESGASKPGLVLASDGAADATMPIGGAVTSPIVRAGDFVADLGAGSAVLSIAAARLGASRVAAIEIDHDSIGNAEENVRANGVADRVEVIEGDAEILLPLLAPVRLVLANIISSVLIRLLPTIRASLRADGQAILSGILVEERAMIVDALEGGGWKIEREDTEDAWWSVQIAPR
jgi:ribosomal protein L11 methyltransferase